ncbi:hypothetical protein ACLMYS_003858 [Salmonella enterica]|nr:hypothetical protein [Salmonella enterica subsp. enterica serovar Typhimurium]
MADQTLDTLPADGKLPSDLPAHPDRELAYAWAADKHETVTVYELTGKAGSKVATPAGQWVVNAPVMNPYTGEPKPSLIPPQWRAKGKSAFDMFNNRPADRTFTIDEHTKEKKWHDNKAINGMEHQPDWSWKPDRPADKPNKLND